MYTILYYFFFFNDPATTEIYTLSLHDALPISEAARPADERRGLRMPAGPGDEDRSEEHTSELQSPDHLVCRLLLEKKKEGRDASSRNGPFRLEHLGFQKDPGHRSNARRIQR